MTTHRPLSDADLLAWAVVLDHRRRQEHAGHRFTLLTFPPCPTCGEQVTQAHTWWTHDPIRFDGFIDMQPCGHQHQATAEDLERLHDHATEMLESLRHGFRSTEDLVQEAHARVGGEPWCCNGNAEDCPLCTDPNPPYPFLCPGHPRSAANERIVGETSQGPDRTPGFVNPPGGTSEQLPADLLAAITLPVYVSTACETALRLEDAAVASAREDRDGDVDRFMEWAGRLHERCRLNHKFTGVRCACNHHGEVSR